MRRSTDADDVLDAAEDRARRRIVRRAEGLWEEFEGVLPDAGAIRRHPFVSTLAAGLIGAAAAPLLLRALGGPVQAFRRAGALLAWTARTGARIRARRPER